MSIIEQCRDITKLNPLVAVMLELALTDIKAQGVTPLVLETYRPQERQNYLYCQGRTVSECIAKGISSTFAKAYSNPKAIKITWTLDSVHKSKKAVDIVPQRKVKGRWTAIWDKKDYQTQIIIQTMQKYGFEAGVNWRNNPDSPHFQVDGDFDTAFSQDHTTPFVTKAIQEVLNIKIKAGLKVDGDWGDKTTDAINKWRESKKWEQNGKIGAIALKALIS